MSQNQTKIPSYFPAKKRTEDIAEAPPSRKLPSRKHKQLETALNSFNASKSSVSSKPSYIKFNYLTSDLKLPYKFKILIERFTYFDFITKLIYNRQEKVTLENVKKGVENAMKRNFSIDHLGQIMSVFPSAYILMYEKQDSCTANKNSQQLTITPILNREDGNLAGIPEKDEKTQRASFIYMTQKHIMERKRTFKENLIKIIKDHHQKFLQRKNLGCEDVVRWHPQFDLESIPDIPIHLPEKPESKVHTAKEILDKFRDAKEKIHNALQTVDENSKEKESAVLKKGKLKGICCDLLEKIRKRESAKYFESMTRSSSVERRLQMIEKLPKITNILWHYFIAERKKAVPVDQAVDKIIHSCNSLSTPDEVKEYLDLIRETMPGWLSIIKISKGEYLTIDKQKDINIMLQNVKC